MSNTAHCPSCQRLVFLPSGAIGARVTCRGCLRTLRIARTPAGSLELFDTESPLPSGVRLKPAEGKWKARFRQTRFWLLVAGALYFLGGSVAGTLAGYRAWSEQQAIADLSDEETIEAPGGGGTLTAGEYRAELDHDVVLSYALGYVLSGIMIGLAMYSRRSPVTAALIALGIAVPFHVARAVPLDFVDLLVLGNLGPLAVVLAPLLVGLWTAFRQREESVGRHP